MRPLAVKAGKTGRSYRHLARAPASQLSPLIDSAQLGLRTSLKEAFFRKLLDHEEWAAVRGREGSW